MNTKGEYCAAVDMKRKSGEKDTMEFHKNIVIKKAGRSKRINGIKYTPVDLYVDGKKVQVFEYRGKSKLFWDEIHKRMCMSIKPPRKPRCKIKINQRRQYNRKSKYIYKK